MKTTVHSPIYILIYIPTRTRYQHLLESLCSREGVQEEEADENAGEFAKKLPSEGTMPMFRYIPPAMLFVDLVYMILHRAVDMRISHDHHYIREELLDTFRYLLRERRGRDWGLRMRVSGRGGRRCRAGDAVVAPAPPPANECPEHGPGPCPPWLPLYHNKHGHGPCSRRALPAPLAPDVAGPSNWAGPMAMDVESAPRAPTPSAAAAGLRRRRSRSPSTIAARRSAPACRIIADPELAAPPPPPQPTGAPRRRVHAEEAANHVVGFAE